MPEQEKAPQEPVLMLLFVEAVSFEKLQNSVLKTWFLTPLLKLGSSVRIAGQRPQAADSA